MDDRKYRQRGYQDSGPRDSRGPSSDRPDRLVGAPKGRGAERNRDEVFRCKSCGEKAAPDFPADATCRKCGVSLHACVQCRHFDTASPNQCRKPIPTAFVSKTKGNNCDLFEPLVVLDLKGKTALETPDQARSAFDKLFGKR